MQPKNEDLQVLDVTSTTISEIPEEVGQPDLSKIYAFNGYYSKSTTKNQMLEKNTYYENLKDFVDEQLCAVAGKISEKKWVSDLVGNQRLKHDTLKTQIQDEITLGENTEVNILKTKELNSQIRMEMHIIQETLWGVKQEIDAIKEQNVQEFQELGDQLEA